MNPKTKALMLIFLGIVGTALFLGGCTMAKISGRGALPLLLNQPEAKVEVIQELKRSKHIMFDYTAAFDVSEVLSEILIGSNADAIINITITVKSTPLDWIVNLFTLGLAQSKTFEISGQAIKAPEGLGSLRLPGSEMLAEARELSDLVPALLNKPRDDGSSNVLVRVRNAEDQGLYSLIRYR